MFLKVLVFCLMDRDNISKEVVTEYFIFELYCSAMVQEKMLLRQHNEAESLHAVQKLDWEWKLKELGLCEVKTTPVIDDICVPSVHVSDEFDVLPA